MMIPLEEQIRGLESIAPVGAEQFRAKSAAISTLNRLRAVRDGLAKGSPDTDRLVNALLDSCGLRPPPPERS